MFYYSQLEAFTPQLFNHLVSSHLSMVSSPLHSPPLKQIKAKKRSNHNPPNLLNRNLRISRRIHNQHTRNRRTRQRRNNTRNKCRQRDFGDTTCLTGCEGREHTDLDTDGRDVTETADGVGGDEPGTFRELEEFVGWVLVGECCELFTFISIRFLQERIKRKRITYSNELIGHNLQPNQLRDTEDIPVSWNTEQERNGVEDVSEDQLDAQGWAIDVQVFTPPSEQSIDEAEEGENAEESSDNHTTDSETEPRTVGESVETVRWLLLVVLGNCDFAGCESLFGFGVAELGDGEGGWDGHDAGGDECEW